MRSLLALLASLGALAAVAGPARAALHVPDGWIGMNVTPDTITKRGSLDAESKRMASAGAESERFAVYWNLAQPYATADQVPPDKRAQFVDAAGVPTDFGAVDAVVSAAARHGLALTPVVLGSPAWAAADPSRRIGPPADPATYARFITALVARYGPAGSFWTAHPTLRKVPVRTWQIWNEVSNPYYWGPTWSTAYPPLLRAGYDAVKAADPSATVVMAGLNTGGASSGAPYPSWDALDLLESQLAKQGLGHPYDLVAAHIYTKNVGDALRVVQETRTVMASHGDANVGLAITELSWPASHGQLRDAKGHATEFFAGTTNAGQASRLTAGMRLLAKHSAALHITSVDWFQWASDYAGHDDPFRYSGLRKAAHGKIVDTPALAAFRKVAHELK
jgi:hypothetical protein